MQRDYELGLILDPEVGDERARAIVERVTQTIAGHNGQVVRVNAWGRRRLAYPIDRHRDGLYFFFDTMLEPSAVAEVERSLRVNEEILRHLMKARDPRVVAQQREREAEAEAQAEFDAAQAEAARQAEAERAASAPVAEETPAVAAAPAEAPAVTAEENAENAEDGATIPTEAEANA